MILIILTVSVIKGQGIVQGIVIDDENGQPLQYATFVLYNNALDSLIKGTITDENGEFKCSDIRYGSYKAKIDFVSFESKTFDIAINNSQKKINLGKIKLRQKTQNLSEIVIYAPDKKYKSLVDRTVVRFDTTDIKTNPIVLKALKTVPGITIDDRTSNIKMLGSENVMVMVNGILRNSLELKSLKTEDVEQVELITNPSSEYNSEYTSIINIILKKKERYGLTLDLTLNGYTNNIYNFSNAKITYGFGKLIINGSYQLFSRKSKEDIKEHYYNNDLTSEYRLEEYDKKTRKQLGHYFNYGFDYIINGNNLVSFVGNYNYYMQEIPSFLYGTSYNSSILTQEIQSLKTSKFDDKGYNYSIFYSHNFKKELQKINLLANYYYADMFSDNYTNNETNNLNGDTSYYYISSLLHNQKESILLEADYNHPFNKTSSLKLGYSFCKREFNNSVKNNGSLENINYTNHQQNAFLNYQKEWKNLSFATGLRYEYLIITINDSIDNIHNNHLPYLSLKYKISNKSSISFSYSNRMKYPQHYQIDPFTIYLDSLTVWQGNPNLKPEKKDRFELTHSYFKNDIFINSRLYLRYNHNPIQSTVFIGQNNVKTNKWSNIGYFYKIGANLNTSFKLFKKIEFNPSIDFFYEEFNNNSQIWNGYSYEFSLSPTLSLKHNLNLGMNLYYIGESVMYQGYQTQTPFFDFFLSKTLFKEQASISIDIVPFDDYYTYKYKEEDFYYYRREVERYKNINIEFIYSFNRGNDINKVDTKTKLEKDF